MTTAGRVSCNNAADKAVGITIVPDNYLTMTILTDILVCIKGVDGIFRHGLAKQLKYGHSVILSVLR